MVVRFQILFIAFVLALSLGGPVRAGEAEDAQVERGVAFYDDSEFEQAKAILLPLAKAGHPKAMHYIGRMHDGTSVFPKDPVVECDWYERAANAGYPSAMYNMSICYDGFGRPDDPEVDKQWLLKAANHGVIAAMINIAHQDNDKGEHYRYWMNKAVDSGSRYAQVALWLQGYKQDVPDIKTRDIVCVSVFILILDGHFYDCD